MVLGFLKDVIDTGTQIVEDTIDVGTAVVTGGVYGDVDKRKIARLISSGMTMVAISDATGIAVDVLEKMVD